jgi:aryl-alcohol dehydrogenase-like predicted oxidoreductase
MRYQPLGNSGLRVSELCLGTMTFGDVPGWGADFDESRRIFETFLAAGGTQRKNIVQTVDRSLERLKTGYLDLLWSHAWDAVTPVEELMRTLDDLVRRGNVLYGGMRDRIDDPRLG